MFYESCVSIFTTLGITFFDDSVTNSEPYPTTAAFKQELIAFHKTLSFQNISADRVTSATNNLNQKKDFKNK